MKNLIMEKSKETIVVKRFGKNIEVSREEFENDNLIYHSLIHVLGTAVDISDYLTEKGYSIGIVKRYANLFCNEAMKHVSKQILLMHSIDKAALHNRTQKDYDFLFKFIAGCTPNQILYLVKLIKENNMLKDINEESLNKMFEEGKLELEPENKGKSND